MAGTENERNRRLEHQLVELKGALCEAEQAEDLVAVRRLRRRIDEVTGELVVTNMKLVHSYAGRFSDSDDEEYANAGRVALVEAVLTWDPTKGNLSTWAMPRVKKAVLIEVARSEHRLKSHAFVARAKVLVAIRELRERLGRLPDDAEVARESGVAESMVHQLRLNEAAGKTRSLNKVVGDDGTELGEVAGPTCPSAEDELLSVEDHSQLALSQRSISELKSLFARCSLFEVCVSLRYLGADGSQEREDFQEMAPRFAQ